MLSLPGFCSAKIIPLPEDVTFREKLEWERYKTLSLPPREVLASRTTEIHCTLREVHLNSDEKEMIQRDRIMLAAQFMLVYGLWIAGLVGLLTVCALLLSLLL